MRSFAKLFVLSFAAVFYLGCSGRPSANLDANAAANAEAVKESPFANITDANAALTEGNRLLDDNQTELSIEAFKQAVKLDPNLAEAHFKMGIAYALIEAEILQAGADTIDSSNPDGKASAAKSSSQKQFEKAVAGYKKLVAADPKDDVSQYNLGRAYNKLNRDDDAEDALRAAVKLKPEDTEYQTELGAILIKLAKYHEAIPPLKKALDIDPENLRAENLLEDAQAGAKRVDFSQPDKDSKKSNSNANANSNMASNGNMSVNANSSTHAANSNTKARKDEPKDKHPEKTPTKPNERH